MTNETLLEVVKLDLQELSLRASGRFDDAVAHQNLSKAVRGEQLSVAQLYSSRWRVFGGRQLEG
jgi:hypothetical protein